MDDVTSRDSAKSCATMGTPSSRSRGRAESERDLEPSIFFQKRNDYHDNSCAIQSHTHAHITTYLSMRHTPVKPNAVVGPLAKSLGDGNGPVSVVVSVIVTSARLASDTATGVSTSAPVVSFTVASLGPPSPPVTFAVSGVSLASAGGPCEAPCDLRFVRRRVGNGPKFFNGSNNAAGQP
jgi:hypothetical protein